MKARPLPRSPEEWLAEIQLALRDARATKPFALLTGTILTEKKLFHLAPQVAFKFRGLDLPEQERNGVVGAALTNYVVLTDPDSPSYIADLKRKPGLAFALCYVATHFELKLVTQDEASAVMTYCEEHLDR